MTHAKLIPPPIEQMRTLSDVDLEKLHHDMRAARLEMDAYIESRRCGADIEDPAYIEWRRGALFARGRLRAGEHNATAVQAERRHAAIDYRTLTNNLYDAVRNFLTDDGDENWNALEAAHQAIPVPYRHLPKTEKGAA